MSMPRIACTASMTGARHRLAHGLFQPLDPFPDLSYSQQDFLESDALLAMLKLEAGEPVDVRPPPGFLARIVTAETKQKRGDVLALDSVVLDRGIASPHEVPHRLVTLIRHPDRR